MHLRYCKILLLAANAFFLLLVVFNNITDYGSNYAFVENVLNMSTTFPDNAAMWRAIENPVIYHTFYVSIIGWEALAMVIIGIGTWKLWQAREDKAELFNMAKKWGCYGLTVSLLQWYVAFLTVGSEWFLMWQSESWNGQDAAHRMFVVMGVCLVLLALKDEDITELQRA